MTAIGLLLFVFGVFCANVFPPGRFGLDWRDWLSGVPALVGFVLLVAGAVTWLWRVMP